MRRRLGWSSGIGATTGVTLGGQTFGTSTTTGTPTGHRALDTIGPSSSGYVVELPRASAAMLTLGAAPPAR